MVDIFYYRSNGRLAENIYQDYLAELPPTLQEKVSSYRNWQDAQRSLAGNILLKKGLEILNIPGYSLHRLKYATYLKPYFDEQVKFNISHSGDYTICAISQTHEVGIDVEEINEIPLIDFDEFFYEEEWRAVLDAPDPLLAFYNLWTKKEAFLKVIGAGLNVPLNQVGIKNNVIKWKDHEWILQPIPLHPSHVCHLCTNTPGPQVTISGLKL